MYHFYDHGMYAEPAKYPYIFDQNVTRILGNGTMLSSLTYWRKANDNILFYI